MTNMNHLILLCALCLPASISFKTSASEDAKNRELNVLTNVKSQLQRIHWHTLHDDKNWIFTVETKLDNGNTGEKIQQTKQRFDPDMPPAQQWQLLESDFAMPTPARLAQFKETQLQMAESSERHNIGDIKIVDLSTLKFLDQNEQQKRFGFTPNLPMFDEEINQIFKGVLLFDTEKQRITNLLIEAKESFSPQVSFKVDSYLLSIDIDEREGHLHVVSINSEKTGSAFFFTGFDETSSRVFSNFKKVN